MSGYEPKVGDRVRVVLEGEVREIGTSPERWTLIGGTCFPIGVSEVVSVEKVTPPLPTTPGSVIRQPHYSDSGRFWRYVRVFDGRWLSLDNGDHYPSDEFGADPDDIEVIFNAGAES